MKRTPRGLVVLTTLALAAAGLVGLPSTAEAAPYNGPLRQYTEVVAGTGGISVDSDAVPFQGKLYFSANPTDQINDKELWVTDGTAAGTHPVADLNPGTDGSSPLGMTVMGDNLYFSASRPDVKRELFKTDGTAITLVKDINPSTGIYSGIETSSFAVSGGKLFFSGCDSPDNSNCEPWVSDGTPGGTQKIVELNTATIMNVPIGSNPRSWTSMTNGYAGFIGFTDATGSEIFTTDGTAAGTTVHEVNLSTTGEKGANPSAVSALGNGLVFNGDAATGMGNELYGITGPSAAAALIANINPDAPMSAASSGPSTFRPFLDGKVSFTAAKDGQGGELWVTDGTPGGTVQATNIGPSAADANLGLARADGAPALYKGESYFRAGGNDQVGSELYATKGSPITTRVASDVDQTPTYGSTPGYLTPVADQLAFIANTVDNGMSAYDYELYATDGTQAGTRRIADLFPGTNNANGAGGVKNILGTIGGTLIVLGNNGQTGPELYSVDFTQPAPPPPPPAPPVPAVKSTISLSVKKFYSLNNAKKKKIRVPVAVSAPGLLPTGTVTLSEKGKVVGTGALTGGVASVPITAKLKAGKHTLVATYAGSAAALTSVSTPVSFKVKGGKKPKKR